MKIKKVLMYRHEGTEEWSEFTKEEFESETYDQVFAWYGSGSEYTIHYKVVEVPMVEAIEGAS